MLRNLDITLPEKGVSMLRFLKTAAAKKGSTSAGMTDKFHSEKKQFFYRSEGVSMLRYIQDIRSRRVVISEL